MNEQDQIGIIKAHMAGKRVLEKQRCSDAGEPEPDWLPLIRSEYVFDFRHCEYKIEPRKLELFMSLPNGVLQALGRADTYTANPNVWVGNTPPHEIKPGHVVIKIHCTELEN